MSRTCEPINVFSQRIDPRGVVDALRRVAGEVRAEGPEDNWHRVIAFGGRSWLKSRARLAVGHDSAFYHRPDWANYVSGMRNYMSQFGSEPRRGQVLDVVSSFRFILSFPDFDLDIASNDERVAWVHEICRQLDGIIFLPTRLLDAAGRVLIAADNYCVPAAVVPRVLAASDQSQPVADSAGEPSDWTPCPPTAERVARRAVVLAAVANRGLLELGPEPAIGETCRSMIDWINSVGAHDEVEPDEWKLLQTPSRHVPNQDAIDATWQCEGLAVLLWALGQFELPPYDEAASTTKVFKRIALMNIRRARKLVAAAQLRPLDELRQYQNHAIMAHWRLRNYWVHRESVDFVAMSEDCWIGTFDVRRFRIRDNDVLIGKRSLSQVDYETFATCHRSADARHQAIGWLLGDAKKYSHVETHT